jgi:hypothetical protein
VAGVLEEAGSALMPPLARGTCSVCGREVALRVNGTPREHFPPAAVRHAGLTSGFGKCAGSSMPLGLHVGARVLAVGHAEPEPERAHRDGAYNAKAAA